MITQDTTYGEILAIPERDNMKGFILDPPMEGPVNTIIPEGEIKNITLAEHAARISPAWNADMMVDGLNYLVEKAKAGEIRKCEIYTDSEKQQESSKMRTGLLYCPAKQKGSFVLICAGGAYLGVANLVEAFPVAKRLNELGIGVFILRYRAGALGAAKKSGEDLKRALSWIMKHAQELNVEKRYALLGFSAGGHLVAEFGTSNHGYQNAQLPKPELLILGYPFITYDCIAEDDPMLCIMAEDGDVDGLKKEYYPLSYLHDDFPRIFIWQTVEDELVPYEENGNALYRALMKLQIPCMRKEILHGLHGLGLGTGTDAEGWLEEPVAYWKQ